ncbi:hypothetical protein [Kitasatospora aureofaciens]|uniref:hypothetical protein n=1 Tax=Kitasatospora aureofaciens TaxID=1894 RepID=UPI001C486495|nr:hypothetical protein [Kitasatospora aureofaciens]MBV6696665.1 hypothetical protein [Kitasatospora aureofaciens]
MSVLNKRRKVHLSQQRMADSPFGSVRINYDRWPTVIARVHGEAIPAVTVMPDREVGALAINGQNVPTKRNSRGWDPRRKARGRTALVGDRGYELRPTGLCRAELRRNGALIARAQGTLRSYSPFRTIPGIDAKLSWSQGVDPTDVAVAQAMVVAFGAGAPGALGRCFLFWLDFFN